MTMFDSQEAWRLIPDSDPTAECESVSGSAPGGDSDAIEENSGRENVNLGGEDAIAWAQA
jgi:hypothetical protein